MTDFQVTEQVTEILVRDRSAVHDRFRDWITGRLSRIATLWLWRL
jgi:hypothetical protein